MCGIQISKIKLKNGISHRGISSIEGNYSVWDYYFASLPLSSNEKGLLQPIEVQNGIILFNGEIFNYRDFGPYKSDLHYLKDLFFKNIYNKRFLMEYKKWDGFWAICYINEEGVLFFTDPLGKKQLYYSEKGICSEIKPIRIKSNNKVFSDILPDPKFGTSSTKFLGVDRAIPGKFYMFEKDNSLPYKLKMKVNNYLFEKEDNNNLVNLIDHSVKLRSRISYGKLGLLFSGGLDSSIIAYHLTKNNIPFTAISIDNNEKKRAELVSSFFKFDPIYIEAKVTDEEKIKIFRSYEHGLDIGSVIPQYLLFKECKKRGLHTVLTGDGADEIFSGYSRAYEEDTYNYDVLMELPYYHHIRIDRCSMAHTVECRNPFLSTSIINFSRKLKHSQRKGKRILKEWYRDKIPFIDSQKKPLRWEEDKDKNIINGEKLFNYAFKE